MPAASYITVSDLRDEGITESMLSDAKAEEKIAYWSKFIDQITGQWFDPRDRTLFLDAKNSSSLVVGHPIIQIDEAYLVSGRGTDYDEDEIDVADIRVYNRHLTQGLTRPDDRFAPRIEFQVPDWVNTYYQTFDYPRIHSRFPTGRLIVKLVGVFGFTELHTGDSVGETAEASQVPLSQGHTPYLIERAVMLLVVKDMPQLVDTGFRQDLRSRWALTSEKTADQSYTLASPASIGQTGGWTGDPEIDMLISMFAYSVGGLAAEAI